MPIMASTMEDSVNIAIRRFIRDRDILWLPMDLEKRWNIEVSAGIGYASMNYDKYERPKCGLFLGQDHSNYFGLTKLGFSLIYILK